MLSRERFERSVGQFHDFGNFSLHNTLNFTMADAGQPLQRNSKANSKRLKGGVPGA
jgi:dTDP-4-amino-4,6-dideoxygalactose transaminase